jgi:hypothetical protein
VRERRRFNALHQPEQDVVEHADLTRVEPVGAREKQVRYLPQHLTAARRRAAFNGAIEFGNKIVRGTSGHLRHQFLFRCGTKSVPTTELGVTIINALVTIRRSGLPDTVYNPANTIEFRQNWNFFSCLRAPTRPIVPGSAGGHAQEVSNLVPICGRGIARRRRLFQKDFQ